ncbi:hypothetical protein Tco_0161915 [Tanacetum coccineum]
MDRLRGSRSFSFIDFEVKFLEEENPSEQSRLGILFCKEILKSGMVRMHYAFVHDEWIAEIVFNDGCPKTCSMAKSPCIAHKFKWKVPVWSIKIGASYSILSMWKARNAVIGKDEGSISSQVKIKLVSSTPWTACGLNGRCSFGRIPQTSRSRP